MKSKTYLNKNFRFVFTPKEKQQYHSLRFLVGAGSLVKYIGVQNSISVISAALNSKTDKTICRFRKCGKIEIYVK